MFTYKNRLKKHITELYSNPGVPQNNALIPYTAFLKELLSKRWSLGYLIY